MSEHVLEPTAMRWLRHGLYAVVLYNVVFMAIPLHDKLWGENSLVINFSFPDLWTNDLVMFLHDQAHASLYPLFILLPLVGISLYIWKGYRRISATMVYIGVLILFSRVFLYLTGGGYLLNLLLFYLIWMDEEEGYQGWKAELSNILSNLALWACRIQLIIVYLFTGSYKLAGEDWRSGEAVYLITHVDEYTLPWFEHYIADIHWLMVLANYVALVYFFAFPVFVWSKRFKLPLLAFGVLFHLGLGIVLGVMDFSFVMIVSYCAFLDEKSIQRLKEFLPSKERTIAHP